MSLVCAPEITRNLSKGTNDKECSRCGQRHRPMSIDPTSTRLPITAYPWWKAIGLAFAVYTPLSIVLIAIPPTAQSLWVGVAAATILLGFLPMIAARLWNVWWTAYAFAGVITLQLLLIAIRLWLLSLPLSIIWLGPLIVLYALAWRLPLVLPRLSATIWREQTAPETSWGRGCMAIVLGIGGAAGGIGAVFGLYAPVVGGISIAPVVLAIGASVGAIMVSYVLSHQIVNQSPLPGIAAS